MSLKLNYLSSVFLLRRSLATVLTVLTTLVCLLDFSNLQLYLGGKGSKVLKIALQTTALLFLVYPLLPRTISIDTRPAAELL